MGDVVSAAPTPSEVIDQMLDNWRSGRRAWIKGDFERDNGTCLIGEAAAVCDPWWDPHVWRESGALTSVVVALEDALTEYEGIAGLNLPIFNDRPSTTFADIERVCEKARAALQERGL